MKKYIFPAILAAFTFVTFQSCLDYDMPGDELLDTETEVDPQIFHGAADKIDYRKEISEEGFKQAEINLKTNFSQMLTAQYAMRGGKEGTYPGAHQYQFQFSLITDNYAGYLCLPHNFDGRIKSTYAKSVFIDGANGSFNIVKNGLVPLLNHPDIDSIPEFKAIALLLYDYSSQEMADLFGALPYADYKANKQDHPFEFNSVRDIYYTIVDNIDTITACFKHYETRPQWYKTRVDKLLLKYDVVTMGLSIDNWARFANSLKLRIAMHSVKVESNQAKQWAEEAVNEGVIEATSQEVGLIPTLLGFTNPLVEISETWGDTRMNASFESLLASLKHPYMEYLFLKNSDALVNDADESDVLPADSRIVGLRAGIPMIPGQSAKTNPRERYSRLNKKSMNNAPLYLMKLSEVDFLRAEGSVRGWNMGGTAQFFYERGIDNAYVEDRSGSDKNEYLNRLSDYKNLASAIDYTYIDPMDHANNMPSVTKIGVKWNEGDDREIKLEKIITQKFIALFPNSFEAWGEMRRTGYPKEFPVLNVDDGDGSLKPGDLVRRLLFPSDTDAKKQDIETSGKKALGGLDQQATRVWWDTTAPNF